MWVAGEARTRAACVTLCTRVLVCRAQRSERGRGGGKAEAGSGEARCDLKSGKIGKSGNREIALRTYDFCENTTFLPRRHCCCVCLAGRLLDTLAGAPSQRAALGRAAEIAAARAAAAQRKAGWLACRLKFWIALQKSCTPTDAKANGCR